MLTNLNSMQTTLQDLKEIVAKNQGANHETSALVRQMERLVADIELKARKDKKDFQEIVVPPMPVPNPVVT